MGTVTLSRSGWGEIHVVVTFTLFIPYKTNGLAKHYHLGESTFIFRGLRSDFVFLIHFSKKFY